MRAPAWLNAHKKYLQLMQIVYYGLEVPLPFAPSLPVSLALLGLFPPKGAGERRGFRLSS